MARVVVLLGGGAANADRVTSLLDEGATVVVVDHAEALARVLRTVADADDRRRLAAVVGDPGGEDVRTAALELAREIHGAEGPEVLDIAPGLDPPVK